MARELNISNALDVDASAEGMVTRSVKYEKARKKYLRNVHCCMDRGSSPNFLGKLMDLFEEDED